MGKTGIRNIYIGIITITQLVYLFVIICWVIDIKPFISLVSHENHHAFDDKLFYFKHSSWHWDPGYGEVVNRFNSDRMVVVLTSSETSRHPGQIKNTNRDFHCSLTKKVIIYLSPGKTEFIRYRFYHLFYTCMWENS